MDDTMSGKTLRMAGASVVDSMELARIIVETIKAERIRVLDALKGRVEALLTSPTSTYALYVLACRDILDAIGELRGEEPSDVP